MELIRESINRGWISTLAAIFGSLVGALGSGVSTWVVSLQKIHLEKDLMCDGARKTQVCWTLMVRLPGSMYIVVTNLRVRQDKPAKGMASSSVKAARRS